MLRSMNCCGRLSWVLGKSVDSVCGGAVKIFCCGACVSGSFAPCSVKYVEVSKSDLILFEPFALIIPRRSSQSQMVYCSGVFGSWISSPCMMLPGVGNVSCSAGSVMFSIGAGQPPHLKRRL